MVPTQPSSRRSTTARVRPRMSERSWTTAPFGSRPWPRPWSGSTGSRGSTPRSEDVGPAVVPRDVEVPLGMQGLSKIAVRGDDAFRVIERSRDQLPTGRHDAGTSAPEHVDTIGQGEREIIRKRDRRNELRHADDERPGLDRDVPHRCDPAVAVVGIRCQPDLRAALVYLPPRQRHPIVPTDETTDSPDPREVAHAEIVAGANAVEDTLM